MNLVYSTALANRAARKKKDSRKESTCKTNFPIIRQLADFLRILKYHCFLDVYESAFFAYTQPETFKRL